MLLDTCALLWLVQGGGRLSPSTLAMIQEAAIVFVSAISGFEVGIKFNKQKLSLPEPPDRWFHKVVKHHNLTILPLDLETCVSSTMLPSLHADPCDRFIVAAAKIHNLSIISADSRLGDYGVKIIL